MAVVRDAVGRLVTWRATRTWKATTLSMLTTRTAAAIGLGASVRSAIHSGRPRLSSGMFRYRIALRKVSSV